jgi:cation transport ATPase
LPHAPGDSPRCAGRLSDLPHGARDLLSPVIASLAMSLSSVSVIGIALRLRAVKL